MFILFYSYLLVINKIMDRNAKLVGLIVLVL
jgi:hypothetical protein